MNGLQFVLLILAVLFCIGLAVRGPNLLLRVFKVHDVNGRVASRHWSRLRAQEACEDLNAHGSNYFMTEDTTTYYVTKQDL